MNYRLYKNELVKIKLLEKGDSWKQFEIIDDIKKLGIIFVGIDGENHKNCNIYITWIFFNGYDENDLLYFIQDKEYNLVKELEDKCESVYCYYSKFIVNDKEIQFEEISHYY